MCYYSCQAITVSGKIQDGDHCWWRHTPPAAINKIYLILLRRSKAFQWGKNRFEIVQHIKNSGEGFHVPPLLVPWRCYDFACTSEGQVVLSKGSGWFCMWLHFFIKASFIIDTEGLVLCHERQYFFFFLVVLFQEDCFPSVSVNSNRNFSFKIVWPTSVHQPLFEIWNTSSKEFVRRILKASCLSSPF